MALPKELTTATYIMERPGDPLVRRLIGAIQAERRFYPALQLALRRWCQRCGAALEDRRMLAVVLTDFRLPPHRRLARPAQAAGAVMSALLAAWLAQL